jgi:hypothetical protein
MNRLHPVYDSKIILSYGRRQHLWTIVFGRCAPAFLILYAADWFVLSILFIPSRMGQYAFPLNSLFTIG